LKACSRWNHLSR